MNAKKSKKIKKVLIDKGITQTAIARELGVTLMSVHSVIHSRSKSKRIAAKIKEITGVEL